MSTIDTRTPFFPHSRTGKREVEGAKQAHLARTNSYERAEEINKLTAKDAKVTIPTAIKDFSRIKKIADSTPQIDNTAKIAELKSQIQSGEYKPDYDAIADKILSSEY